MRDPLSSQALATPGRITAVAFPPDPRRLLVAISASGRTAEVVAAAERHRGTAPVLAVTERTDSRLAGAADAVLPLLAGPERGGVACRTHLATLATLLLVGARVTGAGPSVDELRPVVAALEALIGSAADWLPAAVELLDGATTIHVVGPASRPGAAEQAALMLREGPRLPATAWDAGDWPHVGIYTFLHAWNDYWWPLISATTSDYFTLTVGLASAQMNYAQTSGLGFLMAQAVFASIPILVVYILFQKQIVRAMAGTAVR